MIPKDHPRYESLIQREKLIRGYGEDITTIAGLIAHGRGEAFDYLIGEKTTEPARKAIQISGAMLLLAKNPVISVNGNTAALCSKDLVALSNLTKAKLEVNLFYRLAKREKAIEKILKDSGAEKVYGIGSKVEMEGISSERRKVDKEGIYSSDVVLVALEDGDRTEALVKAGKRVIAIDLNPLSRTAQRATITIVDNVVRAIPSLIKEIKKLKGEDKRRLMKIFDDFNNEENLKECLRYIKKRLEGLSK